MPDIQPNPEIIEKIREYVNQPDWEAAREYTRAHPELMEKDADFQFQGLTEMAFENGDQELARQIIMHREALHDALDHGIDEAFEVLIHPPDTGLAGQIMEFIAAPNWEESKKLLMRSPMLLSDQALSILESAVGEAVQAGEKQMAFNLNIHLDLLRNARVIGYHRAFEMIEQDPDEELAEIVMGLLVAGESPDAAINYVQDHPVLQTPEADSTFNILIQAAFAMGNTPYGNYLLSYRDLLRAAEKMGLEKAFHTLRADPITGKIPGEAPAPEQLTAETVVSIIVQNTLAVLGGESVKKEDWLRTLDELEKDASAIGDSEMLALVGAIRRLISGEDPEAITPELTGVYKEGWDLITQG